MAAGSGRANSANSANSADEYQPEAEPSRARFSSTVRYSYLLGPPADASGMAATPSAYHGAARRAVAWA